MPKLDIDYVRAQFPAFNDPLSAKWSFFENAGGSYVPSNVIERLNHFMTSTKVQPYAEFDTSAIAGDNMDKATNYFAEIINAGNDEIIIGGSTTMNMYVLSNAIRSLLNPGDEVIVTNQDHEANIGAWRRLAEHGMIVKEWQINKDTAELEIDDLKALLSKKTKIVAVTHCSNIVGSINDLKSIAELVHQYNAYIVGDGVSYAPHGFPDVKDLDVDFYAFSLYKTYGPHLGLLYGKKEILDQLPNQNHEFLEGDAPYTLNPGGPNHEELSCLVGVYDYFNNLYKYHFPAENLPIREKIHKVNELIAEHEMEIANPLLDYLSNRSDIRLIGKKTIRDKDRAPTIAFTMNNKSSKDLSSELVKHGIATRNDNFYAWRCLMALGIDVDDGVVRTSMVHYNSHEDVEKLIKALKKI
jgi:cysteine desulfurase family protein (TIGR01976 family)